MAAVWQHFRARFPNVEEKPEIQTAVERFGPLELRTPGVRFEVGTAPAPRYWFVNESGRDLVQIQRDRFVRNWRKTEEYPDYCSYDQLRDQFIDDWELFAKFVTEECALTLVPNQCEVTYVNILEDTQPSQLADAITWIRGTYSDEYLATPDDVELTLRYVLKDESDAPWGRLHLSAMPAIRVTDHQPVTRVSVTVRGAPTSGDTDGALAMLDKGHEAAVRGFASITTSEMHNKWERKQ